jgi:hypothetical protein
MRALAEMASGRTDGDDDDDAFGEYLAREEVGGASVEGTTTKRKDRVAAKIDVGDDDTIGEMIMFGSGEARQAPYGDVVRRVESAIRARTTAPRNDSARDAEQTRGGTDAYGAFGGVRRPAHGVRGAVSVPTVRGVVETVAVRRHDV